MGHPVQLMKWLKENTVSVEKWAKMTDEEREGKVRTGIIHDVEKPEFTAEYQKLMDRLKADR